MADISKFDSIIDSREVIARIEELRDEREALTDAVNESAEDENQSILDLENAKKELAEWEADYAEELAQLEAFAEEGESYASDWEHGATLINESYFVEYVQELVSDIGDMPREIPSYIEIDWEATARNIRVDYTEIDFDGETFLVR